MIIEKGSTLLFIGDSITDCGRNYPLGEGDGLGSGYVALVNSLLGACSGAQRIRVLNTGISGHRVTDLQKRWQTDMLDLKPDWLSVMIGINDVWRQFDGGLSPDQVTIDRYEAIFTSILEQARPGLKGLVLMTPYFIDASREDPMRKMMDEYGRVVEKLAGRFDAIYVDTQAAFNAYLAELPTQSLCGDRVHPNQTGHMILARAFLNSIGFEW